MKSKWIQRFSSLLVIAGISFSSKAISRQASYDQLSSNCQTSYVDGGKGVSVEPKILLPVTEAPETQLIQKAYGAVHVDLFRNLRYDKSEQDRPHKAHPGPKFPAVYLWDSAFISLVWKDWDARVAESVILSVLAGQKPDGRIPHAQSWFYRSGYSQPPLLSWAALKLYRQSNNKEFLNKIYQPLVQFHQWFAKNRKHSSGLFYWLKSYESGIDNSQRFGSRDEKQMRDSTEVLAIDLSSYMVLDAKSLAEMAEILGLDDQARELRAQADLLAELINTKLWDSKAGRFYDWDLKRNDFVKVYSVASLLPLVAGVPDPERAEILIADIASPLHFNTTIPFPGVSRSDPQFEKDFWRGPVVVNMAYLTLEGLKLYGQNELAKTMSYQLVLGVAKTYQNEKSFVEYYDPDRFDYKELTRKKGNLYKQITLGSKPVSHFVGWSGLVNTLVHEYNYPQFQIQSCR